MKTVRDPQTCARLVERLQTLAPDSPAKFGSLDTRHMLTHLQDQVRVALGDSACEARSSAVRFAPIRWLMLRLPIPKGRIQTVPEMLSTPPTGWEADLATLETLLRRLAETDIVCPHPVFGSLSTAAWCRLTYSHFDHHLRQFGV